MTTTFAVQNIPPQYAAELGRMRAYIANITDVEYFCSRTYGNYRVPPKPAGAAFSVTEITPRKGVMDFGDRHTQEFPIMPLDVAGDLCREINDGAGGDSFLGVFVCGPEGPTKAELEAAHARLERYYQWCVAEGDKIWQQTRMVILIPDVLKRAAVYLNLDKDREWVTNVTAKVECPGCGSRVRPGIAVCKDCGAILDRQKAITLGIIPPQAEADASEPNLELEDANSANETRKTSRRKPQVGQAS